MYEMNAKEHHVHEISKVESGLQFHVVFQLNYSESEEQKINEENK